MQYCIHEICNPINAFNRIASLGTRIVYIYKPLGITFMSVCVHFMLSSAQFNVFLIYLADFLLRQQDWLQTELLICRHISISQLPPPPLSIYTHTRARTHKHKCACVCIHFLQKQTKKATKYSQPSFCPYPCRLCFINIFSGS